MNLKADTNSSDMRITLAWFLNMKAGILSQEGATAGYTTHAEFDTRHDRGIVVLYNRQDGTPGQLRFVGRVAANIEELMSGTRPIAIAYLSDIDRVTLT
jgi:hypothetical protein